MKNAFHCEYSCPDIKKDMIFPAVEIDPEIVKIVLVSEAPSENESDYYYKSLEGSFFKNTRTAFQDAGTAVDTYDDFTKLGIYLTTAIKCPKLGYLVSSKTIKECSWKFLKTELDCFPNIKVILCMGDFAIKAVNYIYMEKTGKYPIKSGSTYRIRNERHILNDIIFLPSYTQTGDSFNIEKSKRRMIAEDIKKALDYLKNHSHSAENFTS